jgi:serine/threonine protein kinase
MSIPLPDSADLQAALGLSEEPIFVADGGFKAVFHSQALSAHDEAIKAVYLPRARTDEEILAREQLVARAKREIEALRECKHPNIVKLGSLNPVEHTLSGNDYLVYSEEFLPGTSLDKWVSSGKTPSFDELNAVFSALVDLIGELDSLGYLHRDIKPATSFSISSVAKR